MREAVLILLAAVNAAAFVLCGVDKFLAVHHRRRIRERTLLSLAVCLGGCGLLAGMLLFHHKTSDRAFVPWTPLLALAQFFAFAYLFRYMF